MEHFCVSNNISLKHEEECFPRFPNTEKKVGETRRSRDFLTNFEVLGNRRKQSFECLISHLKLLIILGESRSKSSQNFMIIKITFLNILHGSDLLCFGLMNY